MSLQLFYLCFRQITQQDHIIKLIKWELQNSPFESVLAVSSWHKNLKIYFRGRKFRIYEGTSAFHGPSAYLLS